MAEPVSSNFPTSLDDASTLGGDQADYKQFVLSGNIGSGDVTLNTVAGSTAAPCYLLIDNELIFAGASGASSFSSLQRGRSGTTAAAHTSGTAIYVVYAANWFNQLKRASLAIEAELNRELMYANYSQATVMSGTITLADSNNIIQRFNCNGANRIVKLPPFAITNHAFFIINITGAAFTLDIQSNGGVTLLALPLVDGKAVLVVPDGVSGYRIAGVENDGAKVSRLYKSDFSGIGWNLDTFANLIGISGSDAFPNNDQYGLYARSVLLNKLPGENWRQGADELTWTGWATYTGYATPFNVSRAQSALQLYHTSAIRAFYYRPSINGASTNVAVRVMPAGGAECGVMVDDGVNNADGNGANNFLRLFMERTGDATLANISIETRAGGGAVAKTVLLTGVSPNFPWGLNILYGLGTRFTNWNAQFYFTSEFGLNFIGASPAGLTWTPARHGLHYRVINANRISYYDWFAEN